MKTQFHIRIKKVISVALLLGVMLTLCSGCDLFPKYTDDETGTPVASVARISLLKKTSIRSIKSTAKNVFYLMNNSQLLASGCNDNGLLGQGTNIAYDYVVQVKLPERVKVLDANETMAVAVSDSNNIYVWGDLSWWGRKINYDGVDEKNAELQYERFYLGNTVNVTDVSLSENHIAILTSTGTVYTLGFNYGQLGYDFDSECYGDFVASFRPMETTAHAVAIETNNTSTYFLTNTGELYGCGMNKNSELGYIDELSTVNLISNDKYFRQITTAGDNLIALADNNTIYVCGLNTSGVLGLNSNLEKSSILAPISFAPAKITGIYGNDTLNTLYITTEDNKVYACGSNKNNSLYTKDKNECVLYPSLIGVDTVLRFFGTGSTIFYTDAKSNLYAYGNNMYSQIPDIISDKTDKFVNPQRIYANIK